MTKIRKVKRRKKFRVNVNRKRLRNKMSKLPTIQCREIKNAWEITRSTQTNLAEMGLAYNPNKIIKIPNTKRLTIEQEVVKAVGQGTFLVESVDKEKNEENEENPIPKKHVVESLEADAREPRERLFRLSNNEVNFVTYLMDKYGDDYKAMMRDNKNYYQLTWKQIRAKINKFKKIPEQYNDYLARKS